MKKTLILAAVLVCSGVAQADNFICTAKHHTYIHGEEAFAVNLREAGIEGLTYFVDTSRGYRLLTENGEEAEYRGACTEALMALVNCQELTVLYYQGLSISEKDGTLHFLETSHTIGNFQATYSGTCLRL